MTSKIPEPKQNQRQRSRDKRSSTPLTSTALTSPAGGRKSTSASTGADGVLDPTLGSPLPTEPTEPRRRRKIGSKPLYSGNDPTDYPDQWRDENGKLVNRTKEQSEALMVILMARLHAKKRRAKVGGGLKLVSDMSPKEVVAALQTKNKERRSSLLQDLGPCKFQGNTLRDFWGAALQEYKEGREDLGILRKPSTKDVGWFMNSACNVELLQRGKVSEWKPLILNIVRDWDDIVLHLREKSRKWRKPIRLTDTPDLKSLAYTLRHFIEYYDTDQANRREAEASNMKVRVNRTDAAIDKMEASHEEEIRLLTGKLDHANEKIAQQAGREAQIRRGKDSAIKKAVEDALRKERLAAKRKGKTAAEIMEEYDNTDLSIDLPLRYEDLEGS